MKLNKRIRKILNEGADRQIKTLFSFNKETPPEKIRFKFVLWSRYFLPTYLKSKDASFHSEMDKRFIDIYINGSSFLNIAFRGAAKTNRIKMFLAFCIANDMDHQRRYLKVLSKEVNNAVQIVTDVYNIFTKPRVAALYPEVFIKTAAKREERMSSLTTSTGIKMTADSVGTDQRGDIQEESRPDFILFEDFETRLSLMSAVNTEKIWQNMEEARTGLSKGGAILYNCNYISERGNVHKLVKKVENQLITPIEKDGKPTWDRYSKEDVDALKRNEDDFVGEYMCQPSASRDIYFDRESVDKQVPKQPIEEIAGLKIFKKYNPQHRIGSGHDVGKGVGLDHSTSVFMDFTTIPVQVVATYKNNEIAPDTFAYEIAKQAANFGKNYVAVENNYGSTNDILKMIYPTDKIHKTERTGKKILYKDPIDYGWNTNAATKPKMLAEYAEAVQNGLIELNDPDLIEETRSYTLNDFMDKEEDPRLATRHFDLLMAACIAWQINKNVRPVEKHAPDDQYWAGLRKMQEERDNKNPAR